MDKYLDKECCWYKYLFTFCIKIALVTYIEDLMQLFRPAPPPKVSFFSVTARYWREGCSEGCYCPSPCTPRNDRCNLSCSFS